MTNVAETYSCEMCRNKVEVLEAGKWTLVCCGKPMKPVEPQGDEARAAR